MKDKYEVIYDYHVGFCVIDKGKLVYKSGRFANEFMNYDEARPAIIADYEKQIKDNNKWILIRS